MNQLVPDRSSLLCSSPLSYSACINYYIYRVHARKRVTGRSTATSDSLFHFVRLYLLMGGYTGFDNGRPLSLLLVLEQPSLVLSLAIL
jgi:hypothetical protein